MCVCACVSVSLCVWYLFRKLSYYTNMLQGSVCVCPCALGLEMCTKNSWIFLCVHLHIRVTDICNNIWLFYMNAGIRPQLLMPCGPHFTTEPSPDLTAIVFCFICCWCLSFLFPTLPFHLLVCVACSFVFLLPPVSDESTDFLTLCLYLQLWLQPSALRSEYFLFEAEPPRTDSGLSFVLLSKVLFLSLALKLVFFSVSYVE